MDIPGFQVERELAAAGAGRVCLAWQQGFGRRVVLKFADDERYAGAAWRSGIAGLPGSSGRFRHHNIAEVYDTGT